MHAGNHDEEPIQFSSEDDEQPLSPDNPAPAWRILVVDDDEDVHRATRFALSDTRILGRKLELLDAYSAREAREILHREKHIACILLDVVMETEGAGLELVEFVRNQLKDHRIQIVLRTGQPGYAPEISVIRDYDINDYRSKSELTHTRLITTLTAAIRAYGQITTIEYARDGLEQLIEGAAELVRNRGLNEFSDCVLRQFAQLLPDGRDGLFCRLLDESTERWQVLAASGSFAHLHGAILDPARDTDLVGRFRRVLATTEVTASDRQVLVPLLAPSEERLVLCTRTTAPPGGLNRKLLELFTLNVAVSYDNARMFEQVEKLAYFDELTQTPNRAGMVELINDLVARREPFSLIVIDIDHFQTVNDGLGREAGDWILRAFTQRLREGFGDQAQIGRIGGDAFVVILPGASVAEVEQYYEAFCKELANGIQVEVGDYEIPLTVTGGLVGFPEHGSGADELFHNVGIALKHGKRHARSLLCHFTRDFERELKQRLQVARELRTGILDGQLLVRYQPRVALASYAVTGVEALARWNRPGGIVRPAEFMDAAEESGLIVDVGRHVLVEACRQQLIWRDRHGIDLTVSVNVSMRQMRDVDFLNVVDEAMANTGIEPARLEFEVTESVMMEDTGTVQHLLTELRRRGTQIAVDDFGTGYSSLSYLQRLPLDRVKIDQSFVTGVDKRKEDRVIVSMIINMSHLLDLQVVAEGVETVAQEAQLQQLGCDECQGYFYAKPLPDAEIPDFLEQFRQRR